MEILELIYAYHYILLIDEINKIAWNPEKLFFTNNFYLQQS